MEKELNVQTFEKQLPLFDASQSGNDGNNNEDSHDIGSGHIQSSSSHIAGAKKRYRWSDKLHVALLMEVLGAEAYKSRYGEKHDTWEIVAENVNRACKPHSGASLSGRRAKEEFHSLIDQYRKENRESLKRSGSEEEYSEKLVLIQNIIEIMNEMKETNEAEHLESNTGKADPVLSKSDKKMHPKVTDEDIRIVAMTKRKSRKAAADCFSNAETDGNDDEFSASSSKRTRNMLQKLADDDNQMLEKMFLQMQELERERKTEMLELEKRREAAEEKRDARLFEFLEKILKR